MVHHLLDKLQLTGHNLKLIVETFVKLEGTNQTPTLYVEVMGLAMFPKFNVEKINEAAMVG